MVMKPSPAWTVSMYCTVTQVEFMISGQEGQAAPKSEGSPFSLPLACLLARVSFLLLRSVGVSVFSATHFSVPRLGCSEVGF